MLGQGPPALRGLALDIGLAGLPLGVERIELLIQAMLGGFAGVDGAAQRLWAHPPSASSLVGTGPQPEEPRARSIWCR